MTWLKSNFDSKNFWLDLTQVKFWLNENCHDLTRVKSLTQKFQIWLDSSRVSRVNSSDTRVNYQIVKSGPFWVILAILVHQNIENFCYRKYVYIAKFTTFSWQCYSSTNYSGKQSEACGATAGRPSAAVAIVSAARMTSPCTIKYWYMTHFVT